MRPSSRAMWMIPSCAIVALLGVTVILAISPGQVDDFQGGGTAAWTEGPTSPNSPGNVPDGGPAGAGDRYLRNVSSGVFGAGGKMVMFNRTQWTGDYDGAGVSEIEMDLANLGDTILNMRVAIESGTTWWVSSIPALVPTGGQWQHATFLLRETDMTRVSGVASLAATLLNVTEMRILSSSAPNLRGDRIAATVGVDNITARSAPTSGSGRVPDSLTGAVPGQPLLLDKLAGGMIDLRWGSSCANSDTDFGVYEGTLGMPASSLPLLCSTSGAQTIAVATPTGDVFYLIVPNGTGAEGSYGTDSLGTQRTPNASACLPQDIACGL